MALTGTVVRITTRGSKGKRRKQHLIVVPGHIDLSTTQEDKQPKMRYWRKSANYGRVRKAIHEAAKSQRLYRIRDYPEGIKTGDTVSFIDLDERKGGYWEAKIPGYMDSKPASRLSPLEREVRNFSNLAPERASNVISGLSMLVENIKKVWNHIETGWRKGIYERPLGDRHPFEKYISPYVEVESQTWTDKETAIRDYKAILHALTGMAVETREVRYVRDPNSFWGATREVWRERSPEQALDFLRDEVRDAFTRSIRAETLVRFERWIERQRNKFGYE